MFVLDKVLICNGCFLSLEVEIFIDVIILCILFTSYGNLFFFVEQTQTFELANIFSHLL